MFPIFSYCFFFITILCFSSSVFPARILPDKATVTTATWHDFDMFLDAEKNSHVSGMSELKKYFQRFGYLPVTDTNLTDIFDDRFETAVVAYQTRLGLPVTGRLDSATVSEMTSPRCGVSDAAPTRALKVTRRYSYFNGRPRWVHLRGSPATLTYAFKEETMADVDYLSSPAVRAAFRRAFSRWQSVIPVSFVETEAYDSADVKIGFYRGDHGDGEAFDGALGVLAHAFSPENGRFHLDAAERWAVDFDSDESKAAVDLESVATHEIGHVLGLGHSTVKEAVMYPSLRPRRKKVELKIDDVEGVQNLYGSNPNFSYTSLLESENSSNGAIRVECKSIKWTYFLAMVASFIVWLWR